MEGAKTPEQAIAHKRSFEEQQDEDSATMKASEDLKHTRISDKEPTEGEASKDEAGVAKPLSDEGGQTSGFTKETTPERSTRSGGEDDGMMEQISSPKKKRVREQDDETKESDKINKERVPSNGSATSAGRSDRLEPEKKRHRDTLQGGAEAAGVAASQQVKQAVNGDEESKAADNKPKGDETGSDKKEADKSTDTPQTSSSAFASSGFGALAASSTSGFGALAGKPSIFGGGSATAASPFGGGLKGETAANSTNEPKAGESGGTFGGTFGGGSTTGFGGQASSGFGGGFGGALAGGFGSGFGGGFAANQPTTLSTFGSANPDTATLGKPARAFGAPESDEEDESEDDGDGEGDVGSDGDDENSAVEDRRRPRLTRVPVNDGEEDEVTLCQFRAKLYAIEPKVKGSKEKGWKERGTGNLKVNVHKTCVEFDEYTGAVVPGSFDVSLRDDNEDSPPVTAARLIMRQENTHRVILNTVINRALKLEEKPSSTSSKDYMFTAFDESGPVNMSLKMSDANAKLFISELSAVQSGLL